MDKKRWTNRPTQTIKKFSDERDAYRELDDDSFLVDSGEIVVYCSACGKPLVNIWVVKETLPIKSIIKADCAFCDDHSYEITINGKILLGHAKNTSIVNVITDIEDDGGTIIQKMLIETKQGEQCE